MGGMEGYIMSNWFARCAVAFLAAGLAGPALTDANLVMNGGFETTTMSSPQQMNTTNVAGWSTTGYNFIFFKGTADTTGSYTPQFNGNLTLRGPNNGGEGALPAESPTKDNFVAADGAFETAAITQDVKGLAAGTNYLLTFWWAGAQQSGFQGDTTESWSVSLGSQSYTTPTVSTPSRGFSPWRQASVLFSATAATETLSFLAGGSPSDGQPPFSLLDGVSLVAAPEPAAWAVMVAGLVGTAAFTSRRRRTRRTAMA